jgi:hypothetical protein
VTHTTTPWYTGDEQPSPNRQDDVKHLHWISPQYCTPTPRSDGARLPDGTVLYGAEAGALAVHAAARRGA